MKRIKWLLAVIFLGLFQSLSAQDTESGGIWTSISTEKNLSEKISIGTEFEFRSKGFNFERERLGMQISAEYEILNNIKISGGYSYLNVEDDYRFTDDSIRVHNQNRHKTYLQLGWKYKFGDFTMNLREKAQVTFKEETE